MLLRNRVRFAVPALVGGDVGLVVARRGRLLHAVTVTVEGGRISSYEVIAAPSRLCALDSAVLDVPGVSSPSRTQ